ncbi:MAG: hypothetical protein MI725_14740 [Pirellulales bacterium]|nr:hypothetical protein [Pirellulales bacterium]
MNRETLRELSVFGLLLAIGVLGRWAQPTWNCTPLAAVTVLGGYYFRPLLPALLLPVGVLAVSDLVLPTHDSWPVQISVHLIMILPLWLGRQVRGCQGWRRMVGWTLCGIAPATAFYLVTNFAVWAFKSDYPSTLSGLLACYTAGIPFYRTMIAGGVLDLTLLAGCLAIAQAPFISSKQISSKQSA